MTDSIHPASHQPASGSTPRPRLVMLSLPIDWTELGFDVPLQLSGVHMVNGDVGWSWNTRAPLSITELRFEEAADAEVPDEWAVDHVVVLVINLDDAIEEMAAVGLPPRLRTRVKDRNIAFFRAGPIIEVIESPVRTDSLYGVALVTETPLEVVALEWRSRGLQLTDPKPAIQHGRRIMSVRGLGAGLAVMSPDRAV